VKILIVGDWHSLLHEEAVFQAFKTLGHESHRFSWHEYFKSAYSKRTFVSGLDLFFKKFQNKFILGRLLNKINDDLLRKVRAVKPNIIFIYRGTHIKPVILARIKSDHPDIILVGYNNDDPFSKGHPFWLWRFFLQSIPIYDVIFAYRKNNIVDFMKTGAKKVFLLRSWYIPGLNHPVNLNAEDQVRYKTDVVFAGHYEPDGRLEMLEEIVICGFELKIFGSGKYWNPILKKSPVLKSLIPVKLVWAEEYNKALCGAKIALCFLSKINRDNYTRRNFEIPSTRTLMLSEFSEDLAGLFKEGQEAEYFRNKSELISKIRLYISDNELRAQVAQAGFEKVVRNKHDVVSRMEEVLRLLKTL